MADASPLAGVRMFDAFPKTAPTHRRTTSRGGLATLLVAALLVLLCVGEVREYIGGAPAFAYDVQREIGSDMQINLDITVAMKCHYLTIDVRDAVGDRLHITASEFKKDGTTFEIGHAGRLDSLPSSDLSPSRRISEGGTAPSRGWFGKRQPFEPTYHVVPDGPACRIYGSAEVKKVTGNLHITTLGHGYWSWEHTDHKLMNLSHVVHEFSFGPYFPAIAQPLDGSVEVTHEHFQIYQYFLQIVPTRYVDAWRRALSTNQYSVTDYARAVEHGQGVPGLFFKYDVEPIVLTMRERSVPLWQFLVRLAGILGGVWTVAGFSLRVGERIGKVGYEALNGKEDSPEAYARAYSSAYDVGYGAVPASVSQRPRRPSGPTPYGSIRSTSQKWMERSSDAVVGGAREAWNAASTLSLPGQGHRKTESVQHRIFSEEGRAPW